MKKRIWGALFALAVLLLALPAAARAASLEDASDLIGQIKQQLSAAFENMDEEMAKEVFAFLKEKAGEGGLGSEEGLQAAIKAGEEKFGVAVTKEDAKTLVETMEKLEDLGFSAEYIIDKAESLYQEYGAGFVEHVDEIVTGAVKNAASHAVSGFFDGLKNSIKSFFRKIF